MLINSMGAKPPADAVVLFDGTSLENWVKMDNSPAEWVVEQGALQVVPKSGDICTRQRFTNHFLHLEFMLSDMASETGQRKANSGVFLQGRYEIQVLDSSGWDIPGLADCGAIYNQYAPLTNACLPALKWQTYDVIFRAPRCEGKVVKEQARLTLFHNGVIVHNNIELEGVTGAPSDTDVQLPGHLRLQDHGNLIWYRNIWAMPLPAQGACTYAPAQKS